MSVDVAAILPLVSEWGTFALSWVSGIAAVASGLVAWKVYRDQSSPDVIAYVDPVVEASLTAALFVKNVGSAPAYDVSFPGGFGDVPIANAERWRAERSFLVSGIPMLAPGSHRSLYLGSFRDLIERCDGGFLRVRYRRRRGRGRFVEAEFPVEVGSFSRTPREMPIETQKLADIGSGLSKVAHELRALRRSVDKE